MSRPAYKLLRWSLKDLEWTFDHAGRFVGEVRLSGGPWRLSWNRHRTRRWRPVIDRLPSLWVAPGANGAAVERARRALTALRLPILVVVGGPSPRPNISLR